MLPQPNQTVPRGTLTSQSVMQAPPAGEGQIDFDALIAQITQSIPSEQRKDFSSVMQAANAVKWGGSGSGNSTLIQQALSSIKVPQDIPAVVAEKVKKLINIVVAHSGVKRLMPSTFPAALVLALQALRLVQEQMHVMITKPMLAQTMQLLIQALTKMYGITPQMLQQVAQHRQSSQAQAAQPPQRGAM